MPSRCYLLPLVVLLALAGGGCTLVPHKLHQPQFHNPWPQLQKVAIGPFFNLSENPFVNQDCVAQAYFNELQQVPGFEVVPVGVTRQAMLAYGIRGQSAEEFQRLAQLMGVDAIVVGTVNDYSPFYPPRMALTVRWYAANPCLHPMPAGYGLPWGRAEEEFIPDSLVEAAEFELATAQLKTQTPLPPARALPQQPLGTRNPREQTAVFQAPLPDPALDLLPAPAQSEQIAPGEVLAPRRNAIAAPESAMPVLTPHALADGLPPAWPDPRGFVPEPPSPVCPTCQPQYEPILTLTRSYNGHDSELTEALAGYYEFRDEARFGGWQAYLQRSEDFMRFCCYMHITEMLAARGGARETKVVYRWEQSRYER